MTNPLSVVKPDTLKENMSSISSFLKDSYSNARRNIHEGMNFFKDEFSAIYNKTGTYINQMMLPANNYLKDTLQIESEMQAISNDPAASHSGHLVPIEEAMRSPMMEENY